MSLFFTVATMQRAASVPQALWRAVLYNTKGGSIRGTWGHFPHMVPRATNVLDIERELPESPTSHFVRITSGLRFLPTPSPQVLVVTSGFELLLLEEGSHSSLKCNCAMCRPRWGHSWHPPTFPHSRLGIRQWHVLGLAYTLYLRGIFKIQQHKWPDLQGF